MHLAVSLGRRAGTGQTNNAELRYNLTGQNQFDGTESFSIVNFGKGNFNYLMSAANPNAVNGNFFWHERKWFVWNFNDIDTIGGV